MVSLRCTLSLILALAVATEMEASIYDESGNYDFAYRVENIPGVYETMDNSRIYYPDSAGNIPGSAVPCPIVVLGHGFMMGIDRYYSYAEHLASWGYLVAMPTFSNPFFEPEHYTRARCMVDAAHFVTELDQVPGDIFYGSVDRTGWGFTGHSMGGGCAFLAADTFDLEDTLKVIVSFSSPQTTPPVESSNLNLPKLVLSGSVDTIAPWEDVRAAMWADAPPTGAFGVIHGANHGYCMDYSYSWENGGTATITREEQQSIIRTYLTAYLERYLHGDDSIANFMFCYGDSILFNPAFDSVEVRLETSIVPGTEVYTIIPEYSLSGSPNPFSQFVSIGFSLPAACPASIEVLDLSGRIVRVLMDTGLEESGGTIVWDGTDEVGNPLPRGVYVCTLRTPEAMNFIKLLKK